MERTSTIPEKGFNYRVIGVDTFDNEDYLLGDYMEKDEAIDVAMEHGGEMNKTYVYDKFGSWIGVEFGKY